MKTFIRPAMILMLSAVLFTGCTSDQPKEGLRLGSLDLSSTRQGWGKVQIDKSVTGKDLLIAGKKYEFGVGTPPTAPSKSV